MCMQLSITVQLSAWVCSERLFADVRLWAGEQLLARAADHDTVDEMAKMAAASKARMEEAMFR